MPQDTLTVLLAHIQERITMLKSVQATADAVTNVLISGRLNELEMILNVLDAANRLRGLVSEPAIYYASDLDRNPQPLKHSMDDGTQTEYVPESEESST